MSVRQTEQPQSTSASREIAEAYRSLRSTVKFAAGERSIRSVLVVDVDRDRPSNVAAQLAAAFAEAGDRCALIDTNLRDGRGSEAGFFDMLSGATTLDALAHDAGAGQLTRIGPGQAGTPDALAGNTFGAVLERLVSAHGFAVLSTAPLPRYADALAIASRVDAVILVVTAGGTRRPRAIEARDALERVGARILGVVMIEPTKRWFW